jgi:cell division protein DivIC
VKARIVYLSTIILGLIVSFGLARNLYSTYQSSKLLTDTQGKLEKLRAENTRLKEENTAAKDPNFIEREARNRLGLVKPGEVVVVLPDKEATAPPSMAPGLKVVRSIWQQWLGLFFGV